MKKLRCLISLWNGPNMIGAFYKKALQPLMEVATVGPEQGCRSDYPVGVRAPIVPVIEEFQPDVLLQFYSKPDYFPPDLYLVSCPKVWVLYDLHLHANELSRSCPLFDLIVVTDEVMKDKLKDLGVHQVVVVPFAVDRETFYRPWQERERCYGAGFSGSVKGHRQLKEREAMLIQIGKQLPLRIEDRTRTGSEVADFYQDCRAVLNQAVHGDINMRIMEVLLSGRPLVTPKVPGVDALIEDGEHALLYASTEQAAEQLEWLLQNPELAESMARRGQEHALRSFTYERTALVLHGHLQNLVSEPSRVGCHPQQGFAAQLSYHWFRFPGDALWWIHEQAKGDRFPDRLLLWALAACRHLLIWVERFKKVDYFQKL